jgi:uncharacterized DUF497 family protein
VFDLRKIAGFDWDGGNLEKSGTKHGVSVQEAEQLFLNAPEIMADEKHSDREERWLAFGRTDADRLIACAFILRGELIRVISARPMSRRERKWYEKKHIRQSRQSR